MSHFDLCGHLVLPVDQYFQLPLKKLWLVFILRIMICLQQRQMDKFAPFQCLWNRFTENCHKHYAVSAYVTIDEQLIQFRGQCGYCQYMQKNLKQNEIISYM